MSDTKIQIKDHYFRNYRITLSLQKLYKERNQLLTQIEKIQIILNQKNSQKETIKFLYIILKERLRINFEEAAEARSKLVIC